MREEGGTPAIIESIRAGLVFQLKEAVGAEAIREREVDFIAARDRGVVARTDNIEILGNLDAERLSIVSFVVRHRRRATCTTTSWSRCSTTCSASSRAAAARCAGPYGHRLLGIDLDTRTRSSARSPRGCEGIKPGWVRVNFNYFLSETQFQFILDAIHLVARDGWRLLPHYRFDPDTGEWRHRGHKPEV